MMLVNLTPHAIRVRGDSNEFVTIEPSGVIARAAVENVVDRFVAINGDAIRLDIEKLGTAENLPEPKDATLYIVSRVVANAAPERKDLLVPGKPIRDDYGNTVGVENLSFVR